MTIDNSVPAAVPSATLSPEVRASLQMSAIGAAATAFITRVNSLAEVMPLSVDSLLAAQSAAEADEKPHVLTLAAGPGFPRVTSHFISRFAQLHRRAERARIAVGLVPQSFAVALVSEFDALVDGLLRALFRAKPQIIEASERPFTFCEVAAFGSIDALRESLIDKDIESVCCRSLKTDQKIAVLLTEN